jgi:hypothetical protein
MRETGLLRSICSGALALSALWGTTALAAAKTLPTTPQIAASGQGLKDFTPKGWKVLGSAIGDLDADGQADLALVLAPAEEPQSAGDAIAQNIESQRWLVLALRGKDGLLHRSATSQKAVLCQTCGGVFGDPFEKIEISHGVLVIHHYGGSAWRWAYTERFWFRQNQWQEIGSTSLSTFNGDNSSITSDINLLTGEVALTSDPGHGGAATKASGTERFHEVVAATITHAPALGKLADWPAPPLKLRAHGSEVTLRAARSGDRLYVRADGAPWATSLNLVDAHGVQAKPSTRQGQGGSLMATYPLKALGAHSDSAPLAWRWSIVVTGAKASLATGGPKAAGGIRPSSIAGLGGLAGFDYEASPASAYLSR